MIDRRALLAGTVGVLATAAGGVGAGAGPRDSNASSANAPTPASEGWFAPADTVAHACTWMAWPARADVWKSDLPAVREEVARVARAIAEFEPVSMVVRPDQAKDAASACGSAVRMIELQNDDLWMRDIGPIFLVNGRGGLAGVDLSFNGWGNRQTHADDARVARGVLELLNAPRFVAPFVSEGGAIETDGAGTVLATESSIVNRNRNPGLSRAVLSARIEASLGAKTVLWVPGLRDRDITDCHIDALARFVAPGSLVVSLPAQGAKPDEWSRAQSQALKLLEASTDAAGRALRCRVSRESAMVPAGFDASTFVRSYVNWYLCNGAVLIPAFGDHTADADARSLVADLYPGRTIVQLRIDRVAAGGGGIHCMTQQQPAA